MKQTTSTVIPNSEEIRLLQQLLSSDKGYSAEHMGDVFARIVWSRLTEPGDSVAQHLIRLLGPNTALSHLIAGSSKATWLDLIAEHDDRTSIHPRNLEKALARWTPRVDRRAITEDLRVATAQQMRVVQPGDEHWPEQLDHLQSHTPMLLWARGDLSLLQTPSLAVVGARASTPYGEEVTHEMTAIACRREQTIVSGVAYGIDAVAHRTALSLNAPTIAVLAGGADRVYPAGHASLIAAIVKQGLVLAELPPGSAPTRWRFLHRNRVIAALSQATLVTEAGVRSGSINTAGHAAELGRSLGAVPGPITSAGSHGCFHLIREYAATLVANERDLEELIGLEPVHLGDTSKRESSLHRRVLDSLPLRGARSVREIAKHAGISINDGELALAELELLNRVEQHVDAQGRVTWGFSKQ